MGMIFGKTMDASMKKNQEFMQEMHKLTVNTSVACFNSLGRGYMNKDDDLERQIQMQNEMRERMMAMQVAKSREMFYWLGSFYLIASVGLIAGFRKTKKPAFIGPLVPLSFVVGYFGDMAYGNKLHRIKSEAENIMEYEPQLLAPPHGLPTFQIIEAGRRQQMNDQRVKATHEFFL